MPLKATSFTAHGVISARERPAGSAGPRSGPRRPVPGLTSYHVGGRSGLDHGRCFRRHGDPRRGRRVDPRWERTGRNFAAVIQGTCAEKPASVSSRVSFARPVAADHFATLFYEPRGSQLGLLPSFLLRNSLPDGPLSSRRGVLRRVWALGCGLQHEELPRRVGEGSRASGRGQELTSIQPPQEAGCIGVFPTCSCPPTKQPPEPFAPQRGSLLLTKSSFHFPIPSQPARLGETSASSPGHFIEVILNEMPVSLG